MSECVGESERVCMRACARGGRGCVTEATGGPREENANLRKHMVEHCSEKVEHKDVEDGQACGGEKRQSGVYFFQLCKGARQVGDDDDDQTIGHGSLRARHALVLQLSVALFALSTHDGGGDAMKSFLAHALHADERKKECNAMHGMHNGAWSWCS